MRRATSLVLVVLVSLSSARAARPDKAFLAPDFKVNPYDRQVDAQIARLRADSPRLRAGAAEALGFLRAYRSADALVAALNDKATGVRREAAMALAWCGGWPAANDLRSALDEDDSVRAAAAAALAGNDTPEATVLLIEAAEGHPLMTVRAHAMAVLIRKFGLVRVKPIPEVIDRFRTADRAEWLDLVETVKMMKETKAAFAKLGQPLELNPENLVKRNTEHDR